MIDITDQHFDKEVLECELPVLACFTTSWCHACFPTCLVADELVNRYEGRIKFVRIDKEKPLKYQMNTILELSLL